MLEFITDPVTGKSPLNITVVNNATNSKKLHRATLDTNGLTVCALTNTEAA